MTKQYQPLLIANLTFAPALDLSMPPRKRGKLNPVKHTSGNVIEKAQIIDHDPSHPEADERAFRCQFCTKAFHRKEHLQRHERLRKSLCLFACTGLICFQIQGKSPSNAQTALPALLGGIDCSSSNANRRKLISADRTG